MIRRFIMVLFWTVVAGFRDFGTMYTWKSWLFAWLIRVLAQVAMYTLIGRAVGSQDKLEYLLVGSSVFVAASASLTVVASTSWERQNGVLPLIAAAPVNAGLVFTGRSVQWIADGVSVASVSLLGLGFLFGVKIGLTEAILLIPILVVTTASAYCFGLVLSALTLYAVNLRSVVANVAGLVLLLSTGAVIPLAFWPSWVSVGAELLPLTHGLRAIRSLFANNTATGYNVLLEIAVGTGWLVIAWLVFAWFMRNARQTGAIEFDS